MSTPTVFVASATGTQGGALARQLRTLGWNVHATTRNLESPSAKDLAARGVRLTQGDWNNKAALEDAIAGCQYLFLNLMPDFTNPASDIEQGKAILRIARSAGVKHVIFSGGLPIQLLPHYDPKGLVAAYWQSKIKLEEETAQAGIQYWTVLRPGVFMANYLSPKVQYQYPGATETGVFILAIPAETVLPLVDHEDIGKFAITIFQDPETFHGKTIALAGEFLTLEETLGKLARAAQRGIRGKYLSKEEVAQASATDLFLSGQSMLDGAHEFVDLEELKGYGAPTGTFDEFLVREIDTVRDTYKNVKVL